MRSPGCIPGRSEIPTTTYCSSNAKKSILALIWGGDKPCPGQRVCWADARPSPTAGVDRQGPRTLEGCAAMCHDTDSPLDCFISAQINLILYDGCCRSMLWYVCGNGLHPLQFMMWWSVLKQPGLRGPGEIREQRKGYRRDDDHWRLSGFNWSLLAAASWAVVNFSVWKTQGKSLPLF